MANRYLAPTATDFSAAASWYTLPGGAAGGGSTGAPQAGDDLYMLEGSAVLATNLDGLAAIDLGSLTIGPDYAGTTQGNAPLHIECSAGVVTVESSSSDLAIKPTGDDIGTLVAAPAAGRLTLIGGTIDTLVVAQGAGGGGQVLTASDLICPDVVNTGGYLVAEALDSGDGTLLTHAGGVTICRRNMPTLRALGGGAVAVEGTAEVDTLLEVAGATVDLATSGTVASLKGVSGLVTPRGARGPVTVTSSVFYSGCARIEKSGAGSLALVSNTDVGNVAMGTEKGGGFGGKVGK